MNIPEETGQTISAFTWHQLEEGRAYMSAQVGSGNTFRVITTPISRANYDAHKRLLNKKIKEAR